MKPFSNSNRRSNPTLERQSGAKSKLVMSTSSKEQYGYGHLAPRNPDRQLAVRCAAQFVRGVEVKTSWSHFKSPVPGVPSSY